jgi:hypothetical protein
LLAVLFLPSAKADATDAGKMLQFTDGVEVTK